MRVDTGETNTDNEYFVCVIIKVIHLLLEQHMCKILASM